MAFVETECIVCSFYRYVLEPEVAFQPDASFSPGPMAKFLDMPQSPLFTLNLNTPESWMVESVRTRYDLDNIYLEEVMTVSAGKCSFNSDFPLFTPATVGLFLVFFSHFKTDNFNLTLDEVPNKARQTLWKTF